MRKKKRIKKSMFRKLNRMNLSIAGFAILSSFLVVSACGSIQEYQTKGLSKNSVMYSAQRLADAFDLYNEKRFARE